MSPWCDLDLEDSKQLFSRMILWLMMLHHHTKYGNKMSCDSENIICTTFTDIFNLRCDLNLKRSKPIFHRTLWLMMLYYQTVFGCKPTSSLEDTTEIVKFWLIYKPSLWPWHKTQWTNFSAWHSGSWCCITIPRLVTKCSVVQKISSRQTFTNILNLHCDIDQDTPAYDAVLSKQVWLQTNQQFRRHSKK